MRVLSVSCGENHTLALVEMPPTEDQSRKERRLFVWGNNDKLQLGLDNGLGDEGGSPVVQNEEGVREIGVPH